jgi:hypothetical protein
MLKTGAVALGASILFTFALVWGMAEYAYPEPPAISTVKLGR